MFSTIFRNGPGLFLDLFFPRENLDEIIQNSNQKYLINLTKDYKQKHKLKYLNYIFTGFNYRDLQKPILDFKYNHQSYLAAEFGKILCLKLELMLESELILKPDFITFVPPDPKRTLERGYHPPKLIAEKVAKHFKIPCIEIFSKIKSTKAQADLSELERKQNLEKSFKLNLNQKLQSKLLQTNSIWIIDDVITTGSTLEELAKTLKTDFPFIKVNAITLANS